MLASLVIDHLQQTSGQEKVAIMYIYCDHRRQEEQTPYNLTTSVTKQLLQQHGSIPDGILKLYEQHQEKGTRLGFEDVFQVMGPLMAHFSRLYLFVDALDELGGAGQIRQTLFRHLRPLQETHHFNLMTTSRYIPSLALEFHQPLYMDVKASPEDVRRYIGGHMSDLPNCVKKDLGLQEAITIAIVDAVEGM